MKSLFQGLAVASTALVCATVAASPISGAGSSAAHPLYSKWAIEFSKSHSLEFDYKPVGSSAGVKQVKERAVDFGASDVAPSGDEQKKDDLLVFPTAITGVVPIVNVPGVKAGALKLTGGVLADIYLGKVARWNDAAIARLNPGLALPAMPIVRVARQDGSGTTYVFTEYLSKVSPAWKDSMGRNFTLKWADGTVLAKGTSGVLEAFRKTPGAIAYVEYSYVMQQNAAYVELRNKDGRMVAPGAKAFREAVNQSGWRTQARYEEELTDLPGATTWPITTGTFIVLPRKARDADRAAAVVQFFTWGFMKGDDVTNALDLVSLPDRVQARIFRELTQLTDASGHPLRWSVALEPWKAPAPVAAN